MIQSTPPYIFLMDHSFGGREEVREVRTKGGLSKE